MPLTEHPSPAGPPAPTHATPTTVQRHRPARTEEELDALMINSNATLVDPYLLYYPTRPLIDTPRRLAFERWTVPAAQRACRYCGTPGCEGLDTC